MLLLIYCRFFGFNVAIEAVTQLRSAPVRWTGVV